MAVGTEWPRNSPSPRLERERPLSARAYLRMVESGILPEKTPVFLWKGRLVEKMAKNWPHVKSLSKLYLLAVRSVPDGFFVQQEQPMLLAEDGVPEPDLVIYRGSIDDFSRERPPSSREAALVVEVADTSLEEDRGEVRDSYAARGIAIYWIVNLRDRRIEVSSDPSTTDESPQYRSDQTFEAGDSIPLILDGREVARFAVSEILP